ncbi:MAG: spermidine synthase [Actinomycetota bacterium]|nr:spermidine synthase [Actinomycetota bacterium]
MTSIKRRLVLASSLMLILELALIRWLGANIVHLSYFTNFVLLGSFLGIGLGFLLSRGKRSFLPWSPVMLAALVAAVYVAPVTINRTGDQVVYFTSLTPSGPPVWVALPIVFCAVALTMIGPAEAVGRCLAQLDRLEAYRLDLIGSLCGIALFSAVSFLRAPSFVWGLVVAALYVALLLPRPPLPSAVAIMVVVGALALESMATGVSWSPYYKVTTESSSGSEFGSSVQVSVNGVPHQLMQSAQARLKREPQYGLPYQRLPRRPLTNVLIVGAGSGTDVAVALSMGAEHVDAVEIDPRILQIGRQRNPDKAYQDSRVSVIVDDGRAYLQRTKARYDLILFALPDSLALVTGASAIRLESYLFTVEAIRSARRHLSPGGGFAMYNYYREPWLIQRLAGTVETAFGHEPCLDQVGGHGRQAVISAAVDDDDQNCAAAAAYSGVSGARVRPANDDRPFLYFRGTALPATYLIALGLVLLVSFISVRLIAGPLRRMRPYADLFFMGSAFLLLETKNVTTFALLFGTTWVVNAIVFSGVLLAVLLAVETTRRFRTPPLPVVYVAIGLSLVVAYLVPNSALLSLALPARLSLAVVLAFMPIFLANVAFAKRFATTEDARSALAVNILGAMVGGCLEYFALLTGYRAILVVVACLYLLAFVLTPRGRVAAAA